MNIQKVKLDLTVNLLNKSMNNNVLGSITDFMMDKKEEVGNFLGSQLVKRVGDDVFEQQTFSMLYEHCTLNVDVVQNKNSRFSYLKGFELN